jgi:hypothetical protein
MTYRSDPLAQFVASIANVAGDEARKAKLLYLRNALVSYSVYLDDARAFGLLQIAFAIVPVFWPILLAQRYSMITGARKQRQQIANALDVWGADLGDDAVPLRAELAQLAARSPRLLPWPKKQPAQLKA